MNTVTVTSTGDRYTLAVSQLPGRKFGPWDFSETVRDLKVSVLLSGYDARELVLKAHEFGSSTRTY